MLPLSVKYPVGKIQVARERHFWHGGQNFLPTGHGVEFQTTRWLPAAPAR
jgi:hypothetical protein